MYIKSNYDKNLFRIMVYSLKWCLSKMFVQLKYIMVKIKPQFNSWDQKPDF